MIPIISSKAQKSSGALQRDTRKPSEDNLDWFKRHLANSANSRIILVGGKNPLAFRLRAAQAHIRHDLLPSYWSHAMLLGKPSRNHTNTPVYEISLEPPTGFRFPPPTNAVQTGKLGQYRDPKVFPNICLLDVPLPLKELEAALQRFQMQRAVLDAVDLLVRWLAYAWGVSPANNPLTENHGMPSAAMLEVVFGAAGFDLTPGLESRASCPEAIWQAAKWWHEYYTEQQRQPLTGAFHCEHEL